MIINITNSIEQHKIPQRITETKHTDLSCHMGSCMAHLNSFSLRAAGVNYWFFLLARLVAGWEKAKFDMLLHKIDGEMNMQNSGFSVKLRNGDSGDMLHD